MSIDNCYMKKIIDKNILQYILSDLKYIQILHCCTILWGEQKLTTHNLSQSRNEQESLVWVSFVWITFKPRVVLCTVL